MEETLISFETAKLAKEKGFGGKGLTTPNGYFRESNLCNIPCNNKSDFCGKDEFSAPTQSLLQKWLREEHKLEVHVSFNPDWDFKKDSNECLCKNNGYRVDWGFVGIWKTYEKNAYPLERKNIKTYEEALELGLLESLKLI